MEEPQQSTASQQRITNEQFNGRIEKSNTEKLNSYRDNLHGVLSQHITDQELIASIITEINKEVKETNNG